MIKMFLLNAWRELKIYMSKKMFPLYVDLQEKNIVIVGGGSIGCRRIKTLTGFSDNIIVISPEVLPVIEPYIKEKKVIWHKKEFEFSDIKDADIVIAATDNRKVNNKIYEYCRENKIIVNNASDQNQCDFQFPAILEHENIVMGFNSGGADHKKVSSFRKMVENFLKSEE